MGVPGLWTLLDNHNVGDKSVKLSTCAGQSWAVDVSSWIVHGRTGGQGTSGVSPVFKMINTVFYRALCLLKNGIKPVFVLDGLTAPDIKGQTLQDRCETTHGYSKQADSATSRGGLEYSNNQCKQLLEAVGLTVITSTGEAEKTCAYLNCRQAVDACLCDDGDALLYGATVVYRNFDMKKGTVDCYKMTRIQEMLHVGQRDMVVFAILGGCDYGDGVKNVGSKSVIKLINSIKSISSSDSTGDVLDRVLNWKENNQLKELARERDKLESMWKSTHCSQCQHPGSKPLHKKAGCDVCGTCDCQENKPCTCDFHLLEQKVKPYEHELDIRDKAIEEKGFPFQKVVDEFLTAVESLEMSQVNVTLPLWDKLAGSLHRSLQDVMIKMIPVIVHMHLHGWQQFEFVSPERIVKDCVRHSVPCYQVQWKHFEFDKWTPQRSAQANNELTPKKGGDNSNSDPYIVDVPCNLLDAKYPTLTNRHKLSSTGNKNGPKKRRHNEKDDSQSTLMQFFKVKKTLFTESHGDAL